MSEETLTKRLVEQDAKLERVLVTMATKDDVEHVTEAIDGVMQILRRLDQERIFTAEWVRRIEAEVERHTKELAEVKQQLKIA